MSKKTIMMVTLILVVTGSFAQTAAKKAMGATGKKGQLFGIHFNLDDFQGAKAFKSSENTGTATKVKDMGLGIGLSYWKGLTSKIDFSLKFNGILYDYSGRYYGTSGKTEIGLELEPTINIRPINDGNLWAPFLTTGAGLGLYTNHIGGYVPVGGGLQLNGKGFSYLFLQAQYRISLTKKVVPDQLFYSLGFAQSF
jgi:hypothetical protein